MEFNFLRTNISTFLVLTHIVTSYSCTPFTWKDVDYCTSFLKSYFVHLTDSMVQNVFSSLVWGHMCFWLHVFRWDTRGKTKDSESSFVASAQYLEHSSSHPEGHEQHGHVAGVVGGGVGGGGGRDHPHQSYQPQHHHCVSLRVTH